MNNQCESKESKKCGIGRDGGAVFVDAVAGVAESESAIGGGAEGYIGL